MFEKYTEKARRIIFFARYEASQFGSKSIEPEHLLLGLLREDAALILRLISADISAEDLRTQIEARMTSQEKIDSAVELPLSGEAKRVLAYAQEESDRLSHRHIGTEHLLLGLLHEKDSLAEKVLHGNGMDLPTTRQQIMAGTRMNKS